MTQKSLPSIDRLALPPGTLGFPLIGETIDFLISLFTKREFLKEKFDKHGNIFKTHLFGQVVIFVNDTNLYFNENRYVQNSTLPTTKVILGQSSLPNQTGDIHINRRQLLYKAFQVRHLSNYIPVVENITLKYLKKWTGNQTFTWQDEIENYAFELACKFLIGLDNASQTPIKKIFKTMEKGIISYPFYLPWTKFPLPGTTFARALNYRKKFLIELDKLIAQHQQANHWVIVCGKRYFDFGFDFFLFAN
jgi:retinoid hydroxylase